MKLFRVSDRSPAIRRRSLKSFLKSRDGSVAPIIAFSTMALVGAIGLAVDGSRLMLMHSSLQKAADAGGLSAVAKLDVDTLESEVQKFTTANFSSGYVGATIDTLTATLSANARTVTVNATATAPTTFMKVLGVNTMSTSVESVIDRAVTGLELVLVMDNTGSMCTKISDAPCSAGTGITALKTSAKSLLDVLFGNEESAENLYVGIVPFSQTVNVGSSRTDWLTSGSLAALDWGPGGTTNWAGCVEARDNGYDVKDDTWQTRSFRPFYWEDSSGNDWITETTTTTKKNGKTVTTTTKTYKSNLGPALGPNKNCPTTITRLTSKKSELVSAVDAMMGNGNTHINLGAVWGWRLLSPKWRGKWGGDMNKTSEKAPNGLPLDYHTEGMSKAAVIMTDGANTMSSSVYTAYGWLSDKKLGTSNSSKAVEELDTRLTTVCTAMKNAGIIVYTIAFNNPGDDIEELMKDCASQDAFYFNPPTPADLKKAFVMIGGSLSNLRVSK